MGTGNTTFSAADLEARTLAKFADLPQPFVVGEWVEITSCYSASRMVGKMGRIVKIEPKIDFYTRESVLPPGIEIPDGVPYVELPRWSYRVVFSLGNEHEVGVNDIASVVPVDANKGTQGRFEGTVHLVNPNLKKKAPEGIVSVADPSISPGYGEGVDTEEATTEEAAEE